MKKMKKMLALVLCVAMVASVLSGCSTTKPSTDNGTKTDTKGETKDNSGSKDSGSLEGSHVFMFKSTGNSFGDLMYEGFSEYMEAKGEKAVYKSPAETTVAAQVQLLDELITQKVKSITISTNGDAGYEQVFKKAQDAGIKITSIDSAASPDYRTTHINQAETSDIGAYLVQAAVLITLGVDYPKDGDMKKAVTDALGSYKDKEIKLGVLSASIDTPVQNSWIAAMEKELKDSVYAGKVSPELDKKYGNDDLTESTTQAQAFIAENKVNCIISPTTVGIAAAGQCLKSANSKIKLTGLGLPSEMQSFMPAQDSDNAFDYPCPYMMLWDVIHLGAVSAASTLATIDGSFDGKVGSSFNMDAFRDYPATTYKAYDNGDGGTAVLAGTPYVFFKSNMKDWITKL